MKKLFYILFLFTFSNQIVNAQWVKMNTHFGSQILTFSAIGNNLFAGAGNFKGVYISTDNGLNWTQTTLNNRTITSLLTIGNNLLAGTESNGVYITSDNGANWTQTSLTSQSIRGMGTYLNNVYALSYGVYKTTNNGINWSSVGGNLTNVNSFATIASSIFISANVLSSPSSLGVYKSTNGGDNWNITAMDYQNIGPLITVNNYLFGASNSNYEGVYVTSNNGANWTQTTLTNKVVSSFATFGNTVFASAYQGTELTQTGVYLTTNYGNTWISKNQGFNLTNSSRVNSIYINSNYIYSASGDSSIYRRSISEIIGIKTISSEVPDKFSLSQNYPNPFNPSTKIRFNISKLGFVRLKVYDAVGREVRQLVNENLSLGIFEIDFDATELPSGVYYYRLETKDYSETKKMTLIK